MSGSDARRAAAPDALRPIVQLDELTINRIAAGEVIHRPASAIKELLENSIDAGARSVTITLASGGLKLLEISDDGHGIRREDLPLVCERFATSKLRAYADLQAIATFGFRGEALASISHVARVTVTTATAGAQCAYRATYADGRLAAEPGGASAAPRACARTVGTTIAVEDLFANTPSRRRAMRSPSDEYGRVLEVVGKYALAFPHVAMAVRKSTGGGAHADLTTRGTGDATSAVRAIHGGALAQRLLSAERSDERVGLRAALLCSDASYAGKRHAVTVFVNGRLVECAPIAAAIEREYTPFLPRGSHPFALLQLSVPPARVDVNVHPTKADVLLIDQAEAIALVQAAAREALEGANATRTVATASAAILAGASGPLGSAGVGASQATQATLGGAGGGLLGLQAHGAFSQPAPPRGQKRGAEGDSARSPLGGAADDCIDVSAAEDADGGLDGSGQASHKLARTLAPGAAPARGAALGDSATAAGRGGSQGPWSQGAAAVPKVYPQYAVRVDKGSQRGALDAYVTRTAAPRAAAMAGAVGTAAVAEEEEEEEEGAHAAEAVEAEPLAPYGGQGALQLADGAASAPPGAQGLLVDGGPMGGGVVDLDSGEGEGEVGAGQRGSAPRPVLPLQDCARGSASLAARAVDVAAVGSVRAAALGAAIDADCEPSGCALTSILELRRAAHADAHAEVARALCGCVWVGLVRGSSLLVQFETRLLLLDMTALSAELFRQLALSRWGELARLNFDTPAPLDELAAIALRAADASERGARRPACATPMGAGPEDPARLLLAGDGAQAQADAEADAEAEARICARASAVRALLEAKAELLDEYLSIGIQHGCLCSLPQLASGYVPPLCQLPEFVLALATGVDWTAEGPCFAGLATALGNLFAVRAADEAPAPEAEPAAPSEPAPTGGAEGAEQAAAGARLEGHEWTIQHVLLPRLQRAACFAPPRRCAFDGAVTQVACTQTLYRIFERC